MERVVVNVLRRIGDEKIVGMRVAGASGGSTKASSNDSIKKRKHKPKLGGL